MAPSPAPGVALVRVSGLVGPNPFAVVLHWFQGASAPWSQSQINAMGQSVQSHWPTLIAPLLANNVIVNTITTADLSDTTDRSNELIGLSIPGTKAGAIPDLSMCVLINYKTASRYRGGHGRTYLPGGITTDTSGGDVWAQLHVTAVTQNWQTFQTSIHSDMQAAGLTNSSQCVPRWQYTYTDVPNKHKYTKEKAGFLGAFPILSFSVGNQIRTQRRRLGK